MATAGNTMKSGPQAEPRQPVSGLGDEKTTPVLDQSGSVVVLDKAAAVDAWIDEVKQLPFDHTRTHWSQHLKEHVVSLLERLGA